MSADESISDRPPWELATSRSLLADARCDAPDAWQRLVNLYAPLVAAWCRRWQVAEQDIGDVLQEVFAAVAKNLARFRKETPQDTFRGWLATIARNKVRDHFRRRADQPAAVGGSEASQRLAQLLDPEGSSLEADAVDEAAFGMVLQRALERIRGEFQEQTWQAFWGVVVEGQTAAEVAAGLHMQPGAVRVCKSRVLARLRRELGDVAEATETGKGG
jgi:RNA polymerase sigma-70 factor (ECF subfamily)